MTNTIKKMTTAMGAKSDAEAVFLDGLEGLIGTTNTKLDSIVSGLSSISGFVDGLETLLTTLSGYSDGLEAKLDALKTSVDATTAAIAPPNTLTYTTPLSALGNPTVRSGAGHVYAFAATGIVEIRDNTTVLWTTVGNTSIRFQSPLVYSTSLKLFSTLGSNISLQYD